MEGVRRKKLLHRPVVLAGWSPERVWLKFPDTDQSFIKSLDTLTGWTLHNINNALVGDVIDWVTIESV